MAQPFDTSRFEFHGEPFPVAQQVGILASTTPGRPAFSVSSAGQLAYRTGGDAKSQLAWFDRAGKEIGRLGQPEEQFNPSISPDQKRVAIARRDRQGQTDIWLLELGRDASTRLTFNPAADDVPVWSPDGSRLAFTSIRDGIGIGLYAKASDGSSDEELLLKLNTGGFPRSWSSDGRFLLYDVLAPRTASDIWALPFEGDRKPIPVLQTGPSEDLGQFSPDGPDRRRLQ
jgi:Tol biopolymer transport system component